MTDFYLSFYLVHMSFRIGKVSAVEGAAGTMQGLVLHLLMILPVVLMVYALMLTTRKIALLIGVLHLDEDAVAEVLRYMELVKVTRNRIKDKLMATHVMSNTKDPAEASRALKKAELGELAVLQYVATTWNATPRASDTQTTRTHRITLREVLDLLNPANDGNTGRGIDSNGLTITVQEVRAFFDRGAFKAYKLRSPSDKATVQTAKTLAVGLTDEMDDSIKTYEFCSLMARKVAEIINYATERGASDEVIRAFSATVTQLDSVDDAMIEYARVLAKVKMIFTYVDKSGDGHVSRRELYTALRRFKVPLSKDEYAAVVRVIDPDQSGSMNLDEWIDFMMATDADLEGQAREATTMQRELNAAKGDGLSTLVGEGATMLFGEKVGGVVGEVAEKVGGLADDVLDVLDVGGQQQVLAPSPL